MAMYVIVFMDHVFTFKSDDEMKVFLDMLFHHATNGKILYMTIADAMNDWLTSEGISGDFYMGSDKSVVDVIADSMVVLYNTYGKIYDPDGTCFKAYRKSEVESYEK